MTSPAPGQDGELSARVAAIVAAALGLPPGRSALGASSRLLGDIPELDSMAVVSVLGALESHFGIVVRDEEVTAELFETVASLSHYVARKLQPAER